VRSAFRTQEVFTSSRTPPGGRRKCSSAAPSSVTCTRNTTSLHLSLPPALYDEVLHAGWGEPHPISGTMLVFAPRDEGELEVVWRLVSAFYNWATATKNDLTPLHGLPTKTPACRYERPLRKVLGCGGGTSAAAPAAGTPGFELIAADVGNGTIEVAFAATEAFTTPMGDILGGFLAVMLYDTVGPTLLATLEPGQFISTLDLKASSLRPAFPGRIFGRGPVVHREGDIAFLDDRHTEVPGS
jgi:acyl-coenzyme A thioesterase PaaI-like protein